MEDEHWMQIALEEAKKSFREGNSGFGAVVVKGETAVASAHDSANAEGNCTSHAEINAIRRAGEILGGGLSGCTLYTTCEPSPTDAEAIARWGIARMVCGCTVEESPKDGGERILFSCREIFSRMGVEVEVIPGVLREECSALYRKDVREEIDRLRNADENELNKLNRDSAAKRIAWFREKKDTIDFLSGDPVDSAYRLLLTRFHIGPEEAPVVAKTETGIVFHSANFCPTLEACRILGFDTRYVCKRINENSTDCLIKQIDPRLRFSRNYDKLRPYTKYCEEMITFED